MGVLAPSFVIHMGQEIKSVPTWLNSFPEVVLAQGKTAMEAGLHCTTADITADTFDSFSPTALHSSHSLSHHNCRSGRRQALHSMALDPAFSPNQELTTPKPSQHPSLPLHSPTFAGEAPNQVLPRATGGCHSAIHLHSS